MTGPTAIAGSTVGALATWADGQDGWVRVITSTVLARRTALDDATIEVGFNQLLAGKGLSDAEPESTPTIEITEAPADDAPPLRLLRIAETCNVNRLVDGQEIAFNDRITVVYGENASGKTGYARVLKQVAGARSASRVLPDVDTSSPGTPTATIEYALGSETESHPWQDGAPPVPTLARVCVFDAPAARCTSTTTSSTCTHPPTSPSSSTCTRHCRASVSCSTTSGDDVPRRPGGWHRREERASPGPTVPVAHPVGERSRRSPGVGPAGRAMVDAAGAVRGPWGQSCRRGGEDRA